MSQTEAPPQPRNGSVDAFRLLAALFVIVLHLEYPNLPREIPVGMRLLSRWAIPFFFIVSGYFLALKYSQTGKLNVLPNMERLAWMFIVWTSIYAPFVILNHDLTTLLKIITAPTFILFGLFSHTWFLPSLFFGYFFISLCYRYNVKLLLPILSSVSIGMALISGAYKIFDVGFPLSYNAARTWLSIPFLYAGFLLFQKGRPNWQVSTLLIFLGAGLQIFEARYLYARFNFSAYEHQFLIGAIPFALGMAGLSLNNLKILQHPLISKWGSEYSLGVYLIHPAVIFIVLPQLARFAPGLIQTAGWQALSPLVILCVALAVLMLIKRFLPHLFNVLFGSQIALQSRE